MMKIFKKFNMEMLVLACTMLILIGIPLVLFFNYTFQCLGLYKLCLINRANILWFGAPILFIIYLLDIIFNKKKITPIDILIYGLIILASLSTLCSVDSGISLYGAYTRNEGLLSLLAYYLIFLNMKN